MRRAALGAPRPQIQKPTSNRSGSAPRVAPSLRMPELQRPPGGCRTNIGRGTAWGDTSRLAPTQARLVCQGQHTTRHESSAPGR